jgi:hypothetical protein
MFESTLHNLEIKLWEYSVPECQLGFGYVIAKDKSLNSQYLTQQLSHITDKKVNKNQNSESITNSIYKGLEIVTQKSFGILTNEFNYSAKKIYFDDIKKELDYMIQVLSNVSSDIGDFRFQPLDDKPFMQKWFDVIDINKLQPYVATTNYVNNKRRWYYDTFDREDCLKKNPDVVRLPSDVPIDEMSWDELNSPAQAWVRRWFTAYCKETLARVRGKYSGNLKTPDSELTLEYASLQTEAKDEKTLLWEELKTRLERLRPEKQWEIKGLQAENMNKALKFRPFTSPYNVI